MKYKGIEYEIRARPGKNEWSWVIRPTSTSSYSGETRGSRQFVEFAAQRAIDHWLKKNRIQLETKQRPPDVVADLEVKQPPPPDEDCHRRA
jgi:hypothetical protein